MDDETRVNLDTENQEQGETQEDKVAREAYDGQKKRAEKAERENTSLQKQIELLQNSKPTHQNIDIDDPDLKEVIEGYEGQVDPNFIKRLLDKQRKPNEKLSADLQEIKSQLRQEEFNKTFDKALDKSLNENPEYKGIVNPDVIKKLILDPDNKDKTVTEVIEETYGQVTFSKRTLESTRKNVNADDLTDFSDLNDNPDKLAKIKANPESYKKYKDFIVKQSQNMSL